MPKRICWRRTWETRRPLLGPSSKVLVKAIMSQLWQEMHWGMQDRNTWVLSMWSNYIKKFPGYSRSQKPPCAKCGQLHLGECRAGTMAAARTIGVVNLAIIKRIALWQLLEDQGHNVAAINKSNPPMHQYVPKHRSLALWKGSIIPLLE